MTGVRPGPEAVRVRAETYKLVLWSLHCSPQPRMDQIERMLQVANRPAGLSAATREELLPPPSECRAAILQWLDEVLVELRQEEERVLREHDGPQLAFVANQGAVIIDKEKAERFRRAGSEYKTTLYRALNTLRAMRKQEAATEQDAPRGSEGDDSRGSADDAANAGGVASRRATPGRRARRAVRRRSDIDTPATVVVPHAKGVESAPEGGPQVVVELKVEEHAGGVKIETQNEPTDDTETRPEERGMPTAGADDSALGSPLPLGAGPMTPPSAGPEVSQRGGEETFGHPHGGVGRPAPSQGPSEALVPGDSLALTRPSGTLSQAQARGTAAALTRPSSTLSQGERGWDSGPEVSPGGAPGTWIVNHADPPRGPEPPPSTQ
jgi:hypothetical protein